MARQRRGGGFRPPELRGTLGTLLRTTLAQAGTLRDALERGAREGRSRLDSALSGRRRQDALAELGDVVLDLIRRGEIDLGELPEVRDIVAHLDEIDAGHVDEHDEELPAPHARNRFDARRRDDDDGTVSGRTWTPPRSAKPAPRVWRPPVDTATARPDDEITVRDHPPPSRSFEETTSPGRPRPSASPPSSNDTQPLRPMRKDPARTGGIHFDDDEDLSEYMHPDDVPPKGSTGSDS